MPSRGSVLISIVTAAFNAELSLGRMVESLRRQTTQAWELIVVDDGSTDDTAAILAAMAQAEPRIRWLQQPNAGAAAARNRGLGLATADWVLFLDADDTLEPRHLERLHRRTAAQIDAVVCGYTRVSPHGALASSHAAPRLIAGRFADVTAGPPVILHSILLRRALLDRIGGFDPSLRTNEDWDLWGRVARSGALLAREPRPLAAYWATSGSLTRGGRRMVQDAATVLRRMAGEDPRVTDPDPRLKAGLPVRSIGARILVAAVWSTAAAAAVGDRVEVADLLEPVDDLSGWWSVLAGAVLDGLAVGSGARHADLLSGWTVHAEALRLGLRGIGAAIHQPRLESVLMSALELDLVRTGDAGAPMMLGTSFVVPLRTPWSALPVVPENATRVVVKLVGVRPRSLGMFILLPGELRSHASIVTGITRSASDRLWHIFKRTVRLTGRSRAVTSAETSGDYK